MVVGLHILAIGYYQGLNGHDLIGPIITGKRARGKDDAASDVRWSAVAALCGAVAADLVTLAVLTEFRFLRRSAKIQPSRSGTASASSASVSAVMTASHGNTNQRLSLSRSSISAA